MPQPIKIIKSKRRTIAVEVNDLGDVIVKAPINVCMGEISSILLKYNDWILKKQSKAQAKISKLNQIEYEPSKISFYKKKAKNILKPKVKYYSELLNLSYNKIRISGASKRWGSCSSNKTISLNWKLIFAPDLAVDYVVLHEIIHLKHMNHSSKFWNDVEKANPDYKKHRKWLQDNDYILMLGD